MQNKTYNVPENAPETVNEPETAYRTNTADASSIDGWDPNVPFHGTQEEWWNHFHEIEQGEFMTWDEHKKQFEAWKKEYFTPTSEIHNS
jgi:hypothetical protein